jgi:hypothetical protein
MTDIDRDSLLEALASMEQGNFLEGSDSDVLTLLHSSEATDSGPSISGTPQQAAVTRSLQWLSEDDCWRLLKTAVVGRVGLQTSAALVIHPVNFATVGRSVLVRTRADSVLAAAARRHEPVGFEVDELDAARRRGWSVLITGSARELSAEEAQALPSSPEPWAGGARSTFIVVEPDLVTGRRVGPGSQ